MLAIQSTPNHLGAKVSGTDQDFAMLYDALHALARPGDIDAEEPVDLRILGLAYDVRHARMGHRDVEWEDNGWEAMLDQSDERVAARDTHSRQNMLWAFPVLWPEMLFLSMALQDRLNAYLHRNAERRWPVPWVEPKLAHDANVAAIWSFQAALAGALEDALTERKYGNTLRYIRDGARLMQNYLTQYVDHWNLEFIDMNPAKRLEQLSIVAKRLSSRDDEYHEVLWQIEAFAERKNIAPQQVRYGRGEYPTEYEWS